MIAKSVRCRKVTNKQVNLTSKWQMKIAKDIKVLMNCSIIYIAILKWLQQWFSHNNLKRYILLKGQF